MSPKATLLGVFAAGVAVLAGLGFVFGLQVRTHGEIATTEIRRYESYKLADELRQSSDDLTRMARTYVVTGDPIYEQYFNDILTIRNGEKARPRNYGGIYWDLVSRASPKPTPDERPVALEQLMRETSFTEMEFGKLREAQRNSDELVNLETVAMNAVKGRFADGTGQFTIEGKPDLEMARQIMHGEEYHRAKAGIMRPIKEFMSLLESRTDRELSDLRDTQRNYDIIAASLIGVSILFGIFFFSQLRRRFVSPTTKIAERRAHSLNYRLRILAYSVSTMSVIALAVGMMAIHFLYQAALKQTEESLIETVDAQARLIEAVARFDRIHSEDAHRQGASAATISQIIDAHSHDHGIGETGEFTVARLEGDDMVFILERRHAAPTELERIPFSGSTLDEPMRRALSSESGTVVGSDYRGQTVLAAYGPVSELDLGIVAKIDLSEIRAPYVRAGGITLIMGALLILAAGLFMFLITILLIIRVEKS